MTPVPLSEKIETALRELAEQGARISITAVAASAGIPRSSLYRNARELIHRPLAETRPASEKNVAAEVHRLTKLIDALATRVSNQEERLRRLEGHPHTTLR